MLVYLCLFYFVDGSGSNTGLTNGTTNYTYDLNGNLASSTNTTNTGQNKSYTYNVLNLPNVVTLPSGGTSAFVYDATGKKLRKVNTVSGTTTTTDYISGIQYNNNYTTVGYIQTEEGQAVPNGTGFDYQYFLGDNLGNTRVTFGTKTGSAVQIQKDDYYPFGLEINRTPGSPKNEYLYNKKELQEETGLYDYGARFYDPIVARWTTVDPLAEISRRWSPYNYVLNNPIRLIDPDGMESSDQIENDENRWADIKQAEENGKNPSSSHQSGSEDKGQNAEIAARTNSETASGVVSSATSGALNSGNDDDNTTTTPQQPQINLKLSPDNFNFQPVFGSDWQAAGVMGCRIILITRTSLFTEDVRVLEFNLEVGLPIFSAQLNQSIGRREAQLVTAGAYYKAILEVNALYVSHKITDAGIPKKVAALMQSGIRTTLGLTKGNAALVTNVLGTNFGSPTKIASYNWKISDIIGF